MIEKARIKSLNEAYEYYTICAIATAEEVLAKKSTSQMTKSRVLSIARGMIDEGKKYGVNMEYAVERFNNALCYYAVKRGESLKCTN